MTAVFPGSVKSFTVRNAGDNGSAGHDGLIIELKPV